MKKNLSFWLIIFIYFQVVKNSPHPYRHHHNYHRSPYHHHVNYSPYNYHKQGSFFSAESMLFNDLEDSISDQPVKGGFKKKTNQNPSIKTPMKLFSERKNSYLSSNLGSYQEKLSSVKKTNQVSTSSIKSSFQENLAPVTFQKPISNLNEHTVQLPVLRLNQKKIESSTKISKLNTDSKLNSSTITTEAPERLSSASTTEILSQVEKVIKPTDNELDSNSKGNTNSTSQKSLPISIDNSAIKSQNSSKSNAKKSQTDEDDSEIKKPTVTKSNTDKIDKLNEPGKKKGETTSKTIANKSNDTINRKNADTKETTVKNVEAPVAKPDADSTESVQKIENNLTSQSASEPKPQVIIEDVQPIIESSNSSVEKKTEKPQLNESNETNLSTTLVTESIILSSTETVENSGINENEKNVSDIGKSSVDIPVPSNTENSLVLENETNSPLIS